ncbi:MAG: hypothetical protein AABX83_00525 [Nanoarchaeota archaeon]
MSIERACVNCGRCHYYGKRYMPDNKDSYSDERLYSARNEAMIALEHVADKIPLNKDGINLNALANSALQACLSCDYSSPKIVEVVENLTNPEKKE